MGDSRDAGARARACTGTRASRKWADHDGVVRTGLIRTGPCVAVQFNHGAVGRPVMPRRGASAPRPHCARVPRILRRDPPIVLNRHSAFNSAEVGRVLMSGGTFLTQQVHGRSLEDLEAEFDARPQWPDSSPEKYVPRLEAAGLKGGRCTRVEGQGGVHLGS